MVAKVDRRRYRYFKVKMSDRMWYELHKLKADLHCDTWDQFFEKIIMHKKELVRLFSEVPP